MKKLLLSLAAFGVTAPAFAHHPLAGAPMETFAQGVLSGVGHPILGFDHLFFIALIGIAALYTGRRFGAPLAFIGAMLAGTLMMSFGIALPAIEPMIILSLLALGAVVASGRAMTAVTAMALFAVSGLFHGMAFGESIAAQEAGMGMQVLVGYLIGLGVTQYLIALAAGWVAFTAWKATEATAIQARLAGAVVAGMGLFLGLEAIEGAAFAALGLG